MYIFAYGSLMNPKSRVRSGLTVQEVANIRLAGYQRKFNAPIDGYLYLNIVPQNGGSVDGIIFNIPDNEFDTLKKREPGYEFVDITSSLEKGTVFPVFAFIAPDRDYPRIKIPRSYIMTCLVAIPEKEREQWLRETIMSNEIEEDILNPVYDNSAVE